MRLDPLAACTLLAIAACAPAVTADPHPAPSSDTREQTADQQVAHALARLTFGARPGDVERVRGLGVDRWIALQLDPERIDDRDAEQFLRRFPTVRMTASELVAEYPSPQQLRAAARRRGDEMSASDSAALRRAAMESRRVAQEIQSARVARALLSERQLYEVMVDFWANHFSVFRGKGQVRYYLPEYDRAIREHALGSFRDLLGAVAKSPAMLIYLDNAQSGAEPGRPTLAPRRRGPRRAPGLNENYARELLELHTLGVDGGYTQADVVDVARALTGWTIEDPRRGGRYVFRPGIHDAGPKTVLGVTLAPGRGIEDGEQVLDIVARHPSTARFIATKLARRFVADAPPPALVDRAAAAFLRSDGDIREVVRTIVTSPEFFSADAYRSKVKTPFELVVSTLRALNASPDSTPRTARIVERLGQPIFGRETPDGYPDVAAEWLGTGAILARINFGAMAASGEVPGVALDRWPAARSVANASREAQVDAVIASLLGGAASPDTRAILVTGRNAFLEANAAGAPDAPTTFEDSEGMDAPSMDGAARPRRARAGRAPRVRELGELAQIVGLALGSPEFQRR